MIKKGIVKLLLQLLDRYLIQNIEYEPAKVLLQAQLTSFQELVLIFLDSNPENQEQVKEWWEQNKERIIEQALRTAAEIVRIHVKNESLRQLLIDLILGYIEVSDELGEDTDTGNEDTNGEVIIQLTNPPVQSNIVPRTTSSLVVK